jgi:hypothetical protein
MRARQTDTFPRKPPGSCPTPEKHTPSPSGYFAWHEWAEEKAKTHKQIRCPGCGLWAIWLPKGSS